MDKIAILIPCYNESKTIEKVVNDFKSALPDAVIYVYDNNSSDGTDEIARNIVAQLFFWQLYFQQLKYFTGVGKDGYIYL